MTFMAQAEVLRMRHALFHAAVLHFYLLRKLALCRAYV